MSIPKKIHYCWFGSAPLSRHALRCTESWKRYCPDFEIIRWDESNAPLFDNAYVREAYAMKKWAFVSDYVRLTALCSQGGVYLDTDVELTAPLEPFLQHSAFMGFETGAKVATSLMACRAEHPFFIRALEQYASLSFLKEDGSSDITTNVERMTALFEQAGLMREDRLQEVCGVTIYPAAVFSPKDLETGRIRRTGETCAIHHYNASWFTLSQHINTRLARLLGPKLTQKVKKILKRA